MARKRKQGRRSKTRSRSGRPASGTIPKLPPAPPIKLRQLGINDAPTALRKLDIEAAPTALAVELRATEALDVSGGPPPNTVIYIHGIGNKPLASVLKCQWDMALFNAALGDRSRMAYWVNKEYYPEPSDETCAAGDVVDTGDRAAPRSIMGIAAASDAAFDLDDEIAALAPGDPVRQAWLKRVAAKMSASTAVSPAEMRIRSVRAKVIPLPEFLRRLIAKNLTRLLLRDVNDFLFVPKRREAMEQSSAGSACARRRPVRGDRAQPGNDGRVQRPASARSHEVSGIAVRDDGLSARHAGGAGRLAAVDRRKAAVPALRQALGQCRRPA